jgi:hypothetical protein
VGVFIGLKASLIPENGLKSGYGMAQRMKFVETSTNS